MEFTAEKIKISASHLSLLAIVYVRQSTARQVTENTASADYQYTFTELARRYGWTDDLIVELDVDQGISGTDIIGRKGFQWLRQQIYEGRVGAIFCWEASRLARDNSAFAQLIKLCAACDTLIIDEKGVYDANNLNDRIFLGIMGVLSEAEGRRIAEKSAATRRTLALKGELHLPPVTGFIYDVEKRMILDPDEEVQGSVRLFFSKFEEFGSAFLTVKYFNRNKILFPKRLKGGLLDWVRLNNKRALAILRNTFYAGTYAYGRSKTIVKMLGGETTEQVKARVRRSYEDNAVILIHDTHEGYITWEQFLENQRRLKKNSNTWYEQGRGVERNGPALLQSIAYCGRCHNQKPLQVRYGNIGAKTRQVIYKCNSERERFCMRTCLFIAAKNVDRVVADALLEAVSPARLKMTLESLDNVDEQAKKDDLRLEEALKKAREAVDVARERYESISPRNRLVAEEYEDKLEEKKAEVKRLEDERDKAVAARSKWGSDASRESILALPQDIRNFWECETVTNAERKRLLRLVINSVTLKWKGSGNPIGELIIHWATGTSTLHTYTDERRMDPKIVELVRKLAPDHTVTQIISRLNEEGFKPKRAERFDRETIYNCFEKYGIELACRETPKKGDLDSPRGDGRYPVLAVARMLKKSEDTVRDMCKSGIFDAVRDTPRGAYWIKISPEQIERFKQLRRNKPIKKAG